MRRIAAAFAVFSVTWLVEASVSANPIRSGPQVAPPVEAGEPVLDQQLDARRHVRGCSVGDSCTRPQDILREFEAERIPPPGHNPWITSERTTPSALEASPIRIVKKPSELRPDAPWLDNLALPDLPVRWSKRLVDYLVFYRDDPRGRAIMQGWLFQQGKYRDLILHYLRKAKLPEDLLYVAMIESSYDVQTLSRAGALGLWQWMPAGAKIYGLRRDRWVDERKDPYRSTIAQMDYFRDLYQRFGDWHVALAAFNVGYGAMLRSIARYNTNDYYQLCEYENALPWENCWYTPKVLATAIVGKNRAAFGFDKVKPAPAEAWDDVAVPASLPLAVIAKAAGVSEYDVKRLNPHLKRNRTPPGERGYIVRVPVGKKADTQRRLAELQSDWDGYDAYVVAHGERFEDVATTFGISTWKLKKLNDVANESEIEGGTVLVVPRISEEQRAKNRAKAKAKLHASGVDQKDGEPLIVPVPDKDLKVPGKQRVFYRVVAGDSLRSIAKAFGVTEAELLIWNALAPDANVHPRMVLVAWVASDFDPDRRKVALLDDTQLIVVTRGSTEHLDLAAQRTGRVRTEYVARGKEKLEDIAKKFGMRKYDLARINRISYDTVLAKGDTIIVYQVADPKRSDRAEEQWKKTPKHNRGKVTAPRTADTASATDPDEDTVDEDGDVTREPKRDAVRDEKRTSDSSKSKPKRTSDASDDAKKQPDKNDKKDSKPDKRDARPDKPDGKSDKRDSKPDKRDSEPDKRDSAPSSSVPVTKPTQVD